MCELFVANGNTVSSRQYSLCSPILTAHVMAGHTRQFREQFHPLSGSLYDARLYTALE